MPEPSPVMIKTSGRMIKTKLIFPVNMVINPNVEIIEKIIMVVVAMTCAGRLYKIIRAKMVINREVKPNKSASLLVV